MKILIALPAYNEAVVLEASVTKLVDFCRQNFINDEIKIVIADNQSKDQTGEIGRKLADKFLPVEYLFVSQKGKGVAIRTAWQKYEADIYCFMDVDLATDISALPQLVEAIKSGNDLVVGSRYHPQSQIKRSFWRGLVSKIYQLVFKVMLKLKLNDLACGFKAINNKVKGQILPKIENNNWFFDSEMTILMEKSGYKVLEIPVIWSDFHDKNRKSTVNVFTTSVEYIKKIWEIRKRIA